MKAVWSHWTKPLKGHPGSVWISIKHYLFAFVLSFENARKHFSPTCLYTDQEGFRLLIEGVGFPFDFVAVDLDVLNEYCLYWWNMGKFYAYSRQTEPFIHLDNDVFLWESLPEKVLSSPVFAQNPEYFTELSDYYLPIDLETAICGISDGWLPKEWLWGREIFGNFQKSINTGIYGGYRTDFIKYCSDLAFKIINHPPNAKALDPLDDKAKITGMIEMYLPSICYEYHKEKENSSFRDLEIEYLFSSAEDAYRNTQQIKYTHILGRAKRDQVIVKRLEERVATEYPNYYKRIIEYVNDFGELCQVLSKTYES